MRLIDILPKIPQYADIPYARDLECQGCGGSGFTGKSREPGHQRPLLVGWTETNIGRMAIFECPVCGQRFRFHPTIMTWIGDENEFDDYLYMFAERCANWPELKEKLGD